MYDFCSGWWPLFTPSNMYVTNPCLESVVEICSVFSSDQERFPVMMIMLSVAEGGVLFCYFWFISFGLVFSSYSLLPQCPRDYTSNGSSLSSCLSFLCLSSLCHQT